MIGKVLLIINIFLLISIWVFTGMKYGGLPEIIPTHFVVNGSADGFGHKKAIWFLPSIATFLFFILFAVTRNPNSPMLNVPDNFRNKKSLEVFAYSILIPLLLLLGYSVLEAVLVAEGKTYNLGNLFFVFLGLLLATVAVNIVIIFKKGKNDKI